MLILQSRNCNRSPAEHSRPVLSIWLIGWMQIELSSSYGTGYCDYINCIDLNRWNTWSLQSLKHLLIISIMLYLNTKDRHNWGGEQRLAVKPEEAVRNVGFWIASGHVINMRSLTVRQLPLHSFHPPLEEKVRVTMDNLNLSHRLQNGDPFVQWRHYRLCRTISFTD